MLPTSVLHHTEQELLQYEASFAKLEATFEADILIFSGLQDDSALFRHEVAYCLGQRCDPAAVSTLTRIMDNPAEHPM